jgi:hypothetical protein
MPQGKLRNVFLKVMVLGFNRPVCLDEEQPQAGPRCSLDLAHPLRNTEARVQPQTIGISLALVDRDSRHVAQVD